MMLLNFVFLFVKLQLLAFNLCYVLSLRTTMKLAFSPS